MYKVFATDPQTRVNVGIRRRLAPLLDNDLDKIKLLNCLLMTMPGSPILYYGDEIGMGDNIYLGDRNGVRTPMQWSPDRNAGFSRADPQRLYLPPIMDPLYGFQSVNVEAQSRNPSSLLNWMRRIIAVRRSHVAFGRGSLRLLQPGNRKIFAYLRLHGADPVLCVANLSHSPQPVELDLGEYKGRVPVELTSRTPFPPIGELPYLLTLPRYGFYWFELSGEAPPPTWHENLPPLEGVPVLVLSEGRGFFTGKQPGMQGYEELIAPAIRRQMEEIVLPRYLANQRWFSGKGREMGRIDFHAMGAWQHGRGRWLFAGCGVEQKDGARQEYFLPLALHWGDPEEKAYELLPRVVARVRRKAAPGLLLEALADDEFCRDVVRAMGESLNLSPPHGRIVFTPSRSYPDWVSEKETWTVTHPSLEQSNTSVILGDRLVLKVYRKIEPGMNPELEVGRFLTERTPFDRIAPLLGSVEWQPEQGEPVLLALLQGYVENQGSAWDYTLGYLARFLENWQAVMNGEAADPGGASPHASFLALMRLLGQRTGEMHLALAIPSGNPAFGQTAMEEGQPARWVEQVGVDLNVTLDRLAEALDPLPETLKPRALALLDRRAGLTESIRALQPDGLETVNIRYHGDYHLGQVLMCGNDFVIIDFEGEPGRPLAERRRKGSPLKDVAGMLRSFDYAAARAASCTHCDSPAAGIAVEQLLSHWRREVKGAFLEGYQAVAEPSPAYPRQAWQANVLIRLFSLEKVLYELRYELANRPQWVHVPLQGLMEIIGEGGHGAP